MTKTSLSFVFPQYHCHSTLEVMRSEANYNNFAEAWVLALTC